MVTTRRMKNAAAVKTEPASQTTSTRGRKRRGSSNTSAASAPPPSKVAKTAPNASPKKGGKQKKPASNNKGIKSGLGGVAAPPSSKQAASLAVGSMDSGFLGMRPDLSDAKLKLDARLVLVDPSKNMDKFYIIQMLTKGKKAYAWNRWGRTGTSGSGKLLEGSEAEMSKVFEDKFYEKAGVTYADACSGKVKKPLKNKYAWLSLAKTESRTGLQVMWEYYVDDFVDGKQTGWYEYDASASQVVEELYHDFVIAKNANMGNRFVESGHFVYAVDLTSPKGEYTQMNTSTKKVRKIRRRVINSSNVKPDQQPAQQEEEEQEEEEEEEEEEVKEEVKEEEQVTDGTIPLDHVLARLVPSGTVTVGVYGAVLNQCNIGGGSNNNKAYHIYVVRTPQGAFKCFTRWNRVGEEGKYNLSAYSSLEDAVNEFESKFKAKTGNNWEDRANFVKKAKKYELIEMDHTPAVKQETDNNNNKNKKASATKIPPCKLDPVTKDLVEMIFSADMFKSSMADIGIDVNRMPLGSLSKQQIQRAYDVLQELEKELKGSKRSSKIAQLSSSFYTRFPHATGRQAPPPINTLEMLQQKYDLVAVVSDIEQAQEMLNDGKSNTDMHPLDAQYDTLKADLELLDNKSDTYKLLEEYMRKSNTVGNCGRKFKLSNIFQVTRKGEDERFKEHDALDNRKLLWHGTNVAVVAAILKSGLRIMPHSGGRVGRGIYLASEHNKSLGYTSCTNWKGKRKAIMFLAEAALGKEHEITQDDSSLKKAPAGFHSVIARGRQSPVGVGDKMLEIDGRKVLVPVGGIKKTGKQSSFHQDEYLIYQESQHRLRYVLLFDF